MAQEKRLTVVIPSRNMRPARTTLDSLEKQTYRDFLTLVIPDGGRGAPWARNAGFRSCRTELVLFSDDDIDWDPEAFACMIETLDAHPEASYCYGAYKTNWRSDKIEHLIGNQDFSAAALRRKNYISTMSLIRSADFPGFDESLLRLQDWALWLDMLRRGKVGVFCGRVIFETFNSKTGITWNSIDWNTAQQEVMRKYVH